MWDTCYEAGVAYMGDANDVEAAACWMGEPGALARALAGAGGDGNHGFIDELPDRPGHFECHDLYHHAPEYVKKRFDREEERKLRGITLKEIRSVKGKVAADAKWKKFFAAKALANNSSQADSDGCPTDAQRMPLGTTPSPSPSPSTDSKESVAPPPERTRRTKSAKGPMAHLPEPHQAEFWRAAKSIPPDKFVNPTAAAKAWVAILDAGSATGTELAGCLRRYLATFSQDRRCFMVQFHAWLEGAGFLAFLDAERRSDPDPVPLEGRHSGPLHKRPLTPEEQSHLEQMP
jgi:hypothetical protein